MPKFLMEWFTGQFLQLFPLDGGFVLTSVFKRLKGCILFYFLVCFS